MTDPAPDLEQAWRFLELLDPEAEAWTFQTFDDRPTKRGDLAKVTHGALDEEAPRLAAWQQRGAGVYVTVNRTDLRGRKAENIVRVRATFADLDGSPIEPVVQCRLDPHVIVESSPGKYHAYWLTDDLPLDRFKPVQQTIARRFKGDQAVCDVSRVMRLPGFWHLKAEPFLTRIVTVNEALPYPAEAVLAEFPPVARSDSENYEPDDDADRTMSELVRRILTGAEYHSALRDLAYRYVNAGMPGGQVVATLRGLMDARPATEHNDERWHVRRGQIPMLVRTAEAKRPDAPPPVETVVEVLVEWLQRRYQPVFRENGWHFWSSKTGCLVRPGEIMPDVDVIDALAAHPDAPHDNKGQVKRQALPPLFRTWISTALSQLLDRLPLEEAATTICPAAAGRLRKRLQLLMATPVTLSWKERNPSYERPDRVTENRTLASWCWRFVKSTPDEWGRVRSYDCFFARTDAKHIRFAVRPELAHQVRVLSDLGQMPIQTLGTLADRYELGALETIECEGEQYQVVVLSEALTQTMSGSTA